MESAVADPEAALEAIDNAIAEEEVEEEHTLREADAKAAEDAASIAPSHGKSSTVDNSVEAGTPLSLREALTIAIPEAGVPSPWSADKAGSSHHWKDSGWMVNSWYHRRTPRPVERLSPTMGPEKPATQWADRGRRVSFREPLQEEVLTVDSSPEGKLGRRPHADALAKLLSRRDDDESMDEADDDEELPLAKRPRVLEAASAGRL